MSAVCFSPPCFQGLVILNCHLKNMYIITKQDYFGIDGKRR